MSYQSETIATIVGRLNIAYFLPAIQREFVWRPDQIIELFDSLMRAYPISTFLFWELQTENRDKWDAYSFLHHYRQSGTHNPLVSLNGVQQPTLVLDGQQRLTSLLVALRGTYTVRRPNTRKIAADAWMTQQFYLDVLKDPRVESSDETGVRYGFQFLDKASATQPQRGHFWLEVGQILNCHTDDRYYDFKRDVRKQIGQISDAQVEVFERNLDRLYNMVWKDRVISYYIEREQDYDRVLDIFVRANEGGTRLGKSDLLLSMVTLRWTSADGTNAREDIYRLVDRINTDLTRKNDFDKDFVLKTCLVLSGLSVEYKVDNFNVQNLAVIQKRWDEIKAAIERGVDLINWFGIDHANLTSANAVIPLIHYLYLHPAFVIRGTAPFEVRNASLMRRWLTMALLNNVFGGHSDTVLRTVRGVLLGQQGRQNDFPADILSTELAKHGKSTSFDDDAIDAFLSITYGKQQVAFLALSLLYDDNNWGAVPYTQDHLFPKSWFTSVRLKNAGIAPEKHHLYLSQVHRIGNLQLLVHEENQEKSNHDFAKWIATRDASFRKRHLIPENPELYTLERFPEFIAERERLIRERLMQVLAPQR